MIPWYCDANRDHRHSTQWEAEACTEVYERWQQALFQLMAYVRQAEVEQAVNEALLESFGEDVTDG